ncbi:MAG: HopJ type III effector protein [Gammaproteobacteria bacterium]
MTVYELIKNLESELAVAEFNEIIQMIDNHYIFSPTAFSNGEMRNKAGENAGSSKIFYFAKLHELSDRQTLLCFGQYYQEVLADPSGESHKNIRSFMQTGLAGVEFEGVALTEK